MPPREKKGHPRSKPSSRRTPSGSPWDIFKKGKKDSVSSGSPSSFVVVYNAVASAGPERVSALDGCMTSAEPPILDHFEDQGRHRVESSFKSVKHKILLAAAGYPPLNREQSSMLSNSSDSSPASEIQSRSYPKERVSFPYKIRFEDMSPHWGVPERLTQDSKDEAKDKAKARRKHEEKDNKTPKRNHLLSMSSHPGTPISTMLSTSIHESRPGTPTEMSTFVRDWHHGTPVPTASSLFRDSPPDTPVPDSLLTSIQGLSPEMPAPLARLRFYQDLDKMITNLHTFACGLFPQVSPGAFWSIITIFKNNLSSIYEAEHYPGRKTVTLQDPDDDVYSAEYKAKKLNEKLHALKEVYYARKEADKQAKTQKEAVATSKSTGADSPKEQ
ncbi:hypothetical protein BGZ74_003553 [Mortierella antarctica]|nr:hypothetical protein BGZ74_003553 [Mortierella antarctica]